MASYTYIAHPKESTIRRILCGLFAVLLMATACSEPNVVQINRQDQYLGEAHLVPQKKIALNAETGPLFGKITGVVVTDTSFLIVDSFVNRVFQYSRSGYFVGSVSRRGQKPGEYMSPYYFSTAVDEAGNLYLYDSSMGKLNHYDPTGQFVQAFDLEILQGTPDKLLIDREGHLLLLTSREEGAFLHKIDPTNREVLYELQLSGRESNSVVLHMAPYSGFCYNATRDRLYYLVPVEYQIKEIDVGSGQILGTFGVEPPGFQPLAEKHYNLGYMKSEEEMAPIKQSTTFVKAMSLLEDRYLIVGHSNPNEPSQWYAYDLVPPGGWYTFDTVAHQLLNDRRAAGVDKNLLYYYYAPPEEEMATSNGRLESYRLAVERDEAAEQRLLSQSQ